MKLSPKMYKYLLRIYPPYLGAGVKVTHISDDWKEAHVCMVLRWYNKNAVGTQFGGSLYSMVDPHQMILLMNLLGKDYIVWDKSADIDFVRPGRGKVKCIIKISDDELDEIKKQTANGKKYFARFSLDIKDMNEDVVAKVNKVVYVRKRKEKYE